MASSDLFPSGDWYGFYTYDRRPGRHPMDVRFTFEKGVVSAHGGDPVGEFVLTGSYSETTRECIWTKTYPERHSVAYRGYREGKGIWGTWQMPGAAGGFQVWPLLFGGLVDAEVEEQSEFTVQPAR